MVEGKAYRPVKIQDRHLRINMFNVLIESVIIQLGVRPEIAPAAAFGDGALDVAGKP